MWIFGYGSLIWDGWENKSERRCVRKAWADLRGWRRVFNKKSVRNWGTQSTPCPTLNLEAAPAASCRGMAFEFHKESRFIGEMLLYLRRREACDPRELPIEIEGIGAALALVYIYSGANLITERLTAEQLADMGAGAKGSDGLCVNYVKGVAEKLAALGIDDSAVADLWRAVQAIK
jgi:cation transport protein ChaC